MNLSRNRKIITTNDGSHSILVPELNEQYHSVHGAIQEAEHVFLKMGLDDFINQDSPCYQCLFPDSGEDEELRWSDHGVFSPIVGIIGCMQAAEAMKLILKVGKSLMGRLLILEAKDMDWKTLKIIKDPHCKVCSK